MKLCSQNKHWVTLCGCVLMFLFLNGNRLVSGQTEPRQIEKLPGVPDGYTIIDGDIQMPVSLLDVLQQRRQNPNAPQATIDITRFWPNVVIPFEFETTCAATSTCTNAPLSGCVTAANQTAMISAMAVLEAVANIDFQQCANNTCSGNYIHIRDSTNDTTAGSMNICNNVSGNNSPIGMQGGRQIIDIVSWGSQFIIVHELLHSLGFFHEQSRPDRSSFISVNCNNVQGGCSGNTFLNNFPIANAATAFGYYDFDSLMHYGQCAFSIDCPVGTTCNNCTNRTITVLSPFDTQWQNAIGQRTHLSALDSATLSFIYPQANWRFLDPFYNGANGQSNGSFLRPYTTFNQVMTNTLAGGTIWILQSANIPAVGRYTKQVSIKAAPGVTGGLGN